MGKRLQQWLPPPLFASSLVPEDASRAELRAALQKQQMELEGLRAQPEAQKLTDKSAVPHLKLRGIEEFLLWCLVSECVEPIPPDTPDTAAPARLGWTSPHRGGRSVHHVALAPPPLPSVPADTIRMGTRPMPSVLPIVINSACTHALCLHFCQK